MLKSGCGSRRETVKVQLIDRDHFLDSLKLIANHVVCVAYHAHCRPFINGKCMVASMVLSGMLKIFETVAFISRRRDVYLSVSISFSLKRNKT